MSKITSADFSTNQKMLNINVLRYVETFYQYCYHITEFFGESLNEAEMRWLIFIIQRVEIFLKDAPCSPAFATTIGRYKRVLTKLKKLQNGKE